MNTYVVDTSVLVKFVLPDEYNEAIEEIVSLHERSEIQLVAPDFLLVECANVLWKVARRVGTPVKDVMVQLNRLRGISVRFVSQTNLLEDALRLALDMNIIVYDALYCALAQREDAEIITEDRGLRNALDDTGIRYLTLRMWAE